MQTWNQKAHDYEMPTPLVGSLVHRSTWRLWCRSCDRTVYPNVVDLIEKHGEIPNGYFYDRARCSKCRGRFSVNGMRVHLLQEWGDLHRIAYAPLPYI